MKRMILSFATVALLLCGVGQVKAGLVYDNGPINGSVTAWAINFGYQTSDSFTVSSATNLSGAQIGLWATPGARPTSVDWSIGSTAYGSDISSGTAAVTSTFQYSNSYSYDILETNFALSGSLAAGTYWITIQNAVVPNGDPIYWDQNSGPSSAQQSPNGAVPSESFQLYGGTAVPEPSTVTLLGIGLVGLIGYGWRRRRSVTA